jgi:hypothetical protein
MGRLFVEVSALRDREPLHTLAPVGFERTISPSGISRVVQSKKFATVQHAPGNDCFCAQLCSSWRKPVGPQRVDVTHSPRSDEWQLLREPNDWRHREGGVQTATVTAASRRTIGAFWPGKFTRNP